MRQKTLIYLDTVEPLQASWVVFDDTGALIQSVSRGHLEQLNPAAKSYDLTVIVPAQDVLLTHAALPKLSRQQLMQALPFALEEQLIDDVTELHFAIAEYQADGTLPVAIVAKKKMMEWLALLNQFDLRPAQLIPGLFALPYTEKVWEMSLNNEGCAIRTGRFSGFTCDKNNLTATLELGLATAEKKPESIQIYNFSQTSEPAVKKIGDVTLDEIHLGERFFLEKIAAWLEEYPKINLLQGIYQGRRKASETKKIWLLAAYGVLAWVAITFFSNIVSFFILHHQSSTLETAINTIYKKNFPQASTVVAPRDRMTAKLKTLTDQSNKNYFLVLLAAAGDYLTKNPNVQLKALDFRDNQLNLEVSADTFDSLDALTKTLSAQGYTVKQQNAAISGTQVKANLLIQRGTA